MDQVLPASSPVAGRFPELADVALTASVHVAECGKTLPAGARGTVVGVWRGGAAYEVEFMRPFACLVTVVADNLTE